MAERNQFGKYELQSRLAAGGMAEIFKARYPVAAGISKQVVIKKILPHYAANRQFIAMFTNEARIVMGLSHGNIAQVFDFGEIDGDWFIAMEYVDGQPLSKAIKRARTVGIQAIPVRFAAQIAIEMLKGLHYAHSRLDDDGKPLRIVHRDVSPQNVLISYEGQVKLVDFGIAKAKNAGREESDTGAVKGKYSYFSPEQARGKELDARTDVFAAGIVLYEMLCGQLPFQGKMIETMSKIARGQFTAPRQMNPDIPEELEAIILKAMAHEKDARYPTAEAFQTALSRFLYQTAPSFQVGSLGTFLQLLFEPDLVAEGRPVQLPRELLDQVKAWKKPLPHAPIDAPGGSGDDAQQLASDDLPAPRRSRVVLPIATVIALTVGGGIAWGAHRVWRTTGSYSVELSSTPSGATIALDGAQQASKTPATLVLATGTHQLGLSLAGMRDWSREVTRARGDAVTMHAELEALPVVDAGVSAVAPAPAPAKLPEPALLIPPVVIGKTKAARAKLNAARTYKVTTDAKGIAFIAQGAAEQAGVLSAKPTVLKGATLLYAFGGNGKVKLRDNKGVTQTLVATRLSDGLTIEPGAVKLSGMGQSSKAKVFAFGEASAQLLELGKTYQMHEKTLLVFPGDGVIEVQRP